MAHAGRRDVILAQPTLLFTRTYPDDETVVRLLRRMGHEPYSYRSVTATWGLEASAFGGPQIASLVGKGFDVDRHIFDLGRGEATYHAAARALDAWRLFDIGWASVVTEAERPAPGVLLALRVKALGLWSVLVSRVIDTEERVVDGVARHGFAYGTLPHHVESGEERFVITWASATDKVRLEIVAFSRPVHRLARLGYPYVRGRQSAFARAAHAALTRALAGS